MDNQQIGLVGGIAGGVLGVLGGIVGTYFSLRNTNGPKERAFMIRAAVYCWIGVSAFLGCLFLLPQPWRSLLWLPYMPMLFLFIKKMNDMQGRARAEDLRETEGAAGGTIGS